MAEGVQAGDLRDDVPTAELAAYCIHALTAASPLPSRAAVDRLVAVTLDGLRPVPQQPAHQESAPADGHSHHR
ncbi:hypothetical protein ACODT5_30395 [Streptomyces sp. 5.8]|uniref:hypothetical protein n=1 Tax=Streptomyces sp. 5.8 TaxID=3406571 RepID=UPI003BB623F0